MKNRPYHQESSEMTQNGRFFRKRLNFSFVLFPKNCPNGRILFERTKKEESRIISLKKLSVRFCFYPYLCFNKNNFFQSPLEGSLHNVTTHNVTINFIGNPRWPVEVLTLALDETITENFKIRSDVFIQPMFSNYRMLALAELFMKILKT